MDFEEYTAGVAERYVGLSDEEKEKVRSFKASEEGQLVSFLLGAEFRPLLDTLASPKPAEVEKTTGFVSRRPKKKKK